MNNLIRVFTEACRNEALVISQVGNVNTSIDLPELIKSSQASGKDLVLYIDPKTRQTLTELTYERAHSSFQLWRLILGILVASLAILGVSLLVVK